MHTNQRWEPISLETDELQKIDELQKKRSPGYFFKNVVTLN